MGLFRDCPSAGRQGEDQSNLKFVVGIPDWEQVKELR